MAAGANNINGPFFSRKNDKPQRAQAREAAFNDPLG
ncbi:MAG: SIMPL domain-containing protein [Novosphingobium sp.]|nr:SIMPL domain-containing protein [Novosphingobium sp.]